MKNGRNTPKIFRHFRHLCRHFSAYTSTGHAGVSLYTSTFAKVRRVFLASQSQQARLLPEEALKETGASTECVRCIVNTDIFGQKV